VRRSTVHQNEHQASFAWLWVLLGLAGAGAGGYYFAVLRPARAAAGRVSPSASPDSTGSLAGPSTPDSAPHGSGRDSVALTHPDTVRSSAAQVHDSVKPAVADTGSLLLSGLPAGSTVSVDTRQVFETVIRLGVGPHELAISAPRYQFFVDTVEITAGQVLRLTPVLQPFGGGVRPEPRRPAPPVSSLACDAPSPANKFGRACYDKRPLPIGPTRVPLVAGIEGTPSPAVLLIKVSAEGHTLEIRTQTPSGDPIFERQAEQFAYNLEWHPALKGGTAVEGWTQLRLDPE
jgi:hypothetical protein